MGAADRLVIAALVIAALAAQAVEAQAPADEGARVWQELVQAYRIVADLSQAGINTTEYVRELRQALQAIDGGDYGRAQEILDRVMPQLQSLEGQRDSYVLMSNARKYATAAAILAIPPLTYYLLPRAYLRIWYRLRRNRIVVRK